MISQDKPILQPYPTTHVKQDQIVENVCHFATRLFEIQEKIFQIAVRCFDALKQAFCSIGRAFGIIKFEAKNKQDQAIWLEKREGSSITPQLVNTKTEAMDHKFHYVVKEGKVWFKPLAAMDSTTSWKLLGGNGFADQAQTPLIGIAADGDNLITIDQNQHIHYAKTHHIHVHLTGDNDWEVESNSKIEWTTRWFNMMGVASILNKFKDPTLKVVEGARSVAISHKGTDAMYYTDMAGKKHPEPFVGITTLYALDQSGTRIFFADPWLHNKFENEITGPEEGEFIADNMAASASTLFLIQRAKDEQGREINKFYTRFADFDSIGSNPLLPATYNISSQTPLVRFLPGEDWVEQPVILLEEQAKLTQHISILQTGRGQNQRQLRVLGTDKEGQPGYYYKNIYDLEWKFEPTQQVISSEEFLADTIPHQGFQKGPKITYDYSGDITCKLPYAPQVKLKGFAKRGLNERGLHTKLEMTLINGTKLELPLHARRGTKHLLGLDLASNRLHWKLVIPEEYYQHSDVKVKEALSRLFNNKRTLSVKVHEGPQEITLSPEFFSLNKFKMRFSV